RKRTAVLSLRETSAEDRQESVAPALTHLTTSRTISTPRTFLRPQRKKRRANTRWHDTRREHERDRHDHPPPGSGSGAVRAVDRRPAGRSRPAAGLLHVDLGLRTGEGADLPPRVAVRRTRKRHPR